MTIHRTKLPIAALERIDDRCAEFERRWKSGSPQTIEAAIAGEMPDAERQLLLSELLVLEIDYRQRHGQPVAADDYLQRFPAHADTVADAISNQTRQRRAFQPPSIERIAQLFPTLEILSLLGAGGMGAVYQARQPGLDRLVALKILPEELGRDVKFALRFTREARTLAKLNHPNIVSVFEFGNVGDVYYFLMEYVDGSTLRDVVQAGELAPEHALQIVPHLCDALQYAHDQGIVHRDIKPENILLSQTGQVKIADFGLSRLVGSEHQSNNLTQTHQVLGTPRYMAPEQFEGSRRVDHRADIYSLGVVFYEMLTGELPIGRFEIPSQKVNIDVRLDDVVLRTLEREPQRRYQAASEIKSDLASISSNVGNELHSTVADMTRGEVQPKSAIPVPSSSMEQQEVAARLLLSRRELMDRVKQSLRPLRSGHIIQILVGVAFIILGAQCWAQNTDIPHRLICGVILHVYGVIVIGGAAHVLTRIGRMDYSKPVGEIRAGLDRIRKALLLGGPIVGYPWWLMWIPVAVAFGVDIVLHPYCLWVSLAVGIPGILVSLWLHFKYLSVDEDPTTKWQRSVVGESLSQAYLTLAEIERARIE